MVSQDRIKYCYMARKGKPCVKDNMAKKHLKYHECEKCLWRIQSENPKDIDALEMIYKKYGSKTWNC